MKSYNISSPINNTKLKELAKIFAEEQIEIPKEKIFESAISIACFVCSKELNALSMEER